MNSYQVGDLVRISAAFTNSSGAAADPTTVTLLVKLRYVVGSTATTYTYPAQIVKDSTGNYHYDFTPTTEGIWDYRWVGTGTVQAAAEDAFNVPNSEFF
jgi:hypothetical protein